jgi:hypothetical protein
MRWGEREPLHVTRRGRVVGWIALVVLIVGALWWGASSPPPCRDLTGAERSLCLDIHYP